MVLNIADLRNSMLETALEEEDPSSPPGDALAVPELQSLSPHQQQALFLSRDALPDVVGSSQGGHHSSQALAGDRLSGSQLAQGSGGPTHSEDRQHWGGVDVPHGNNSTQDGPMSREFTDAVVGGSAEDVGSPHHSTVRQYGRSSSAMRRMHSRPGLASVRFAEEPPDPPEEQGPSIR